jgi:exopolysaccharide biosynthesis polyprenyl glycosylphosphotransferase
MTLTKLLDKKTISILLSVSDIIATIFSYFLAYYLTNLIRTQYFVFTVDYVYMLLLVIPTWVILIKSTSLSHLPRTRSYLSLFFSFLNFNLIGFGLMFLYKHLFGYTFFSHYFIISFSIINLLTLFSLRIFTYRVLKHFRANGHNVRNIIIVADEDSGDLIDSILYRKEWGYRILMIFTDSEKIKSRYRKITKVLPERANIKNILEIDIIDEVIYCKEVENNEKLNSLIESCKEIGVTFRLQMEVSPMAISNSHLTHFEDTPFITFKNTPKNSFAWAWKATSDYIISFGLLFTLSPLLLVVALIIKLTSKGPVIFKQKRVGLRGRQFYIYKFRTMVQDAEELKEKLKSMNESDGPAFKIKDDPRITRIGKILRKTSIDELPQLFNVLKGEMSLIGPRPPLPSEVEQYQRWQQIGRAHV